MSSQKHETSDHTKTYVMVWVALLILTVVTVAVAFKDFGKLNIVVAMLIASIKAALVALYFMHLKYDERVNQLTFISSILFLGIFVALTMADTETRPPVQAAVVTPIEAPAGNQAAVHEKLRKSTPELIAQGKTLYGGTCAMCHGPEGKGDGPAAGGMNPKPRNFAVGDGWIVGRAPAQVYLTLSKGAGAMPSFDALSVEQKWALVHYVNSLGPTPPEDTPKTLEAIGAGGSGNAVKVMPELPVDFIIDRISAEKNPQ